MTAPLTKAQIQELVVEYRDRHVTMIELAARYGKTRAGIHKLLKAAGVPTSKAAAHLPTTCAHCGAAITMIRCRYRKANHHFCCKDHFYLWLNRPVAPFIKYRHGLRIARKVIREHFFVAPGMVVHHIDRDQGNNAISNLMVFNSNADHVKFHRDIAATPVFDGRLVVPIAKPPVTKEEKQRLSLRERVAAALHPVV